MRNLHDLLACRLSSPCGNQYMYFETNYELFYYLITELVFRHSSQPKMSGLSLTVKRGHFSHKLLAKPVYQCTSITLYFRSRAGTVVRALTFHLCGSGSIPDLMPFLWIEFVGSRSTLLGEVFTRVLLFSPFLKNQHLI